MSESSIASGAGSGIGVSDLSLRGLFEGLSVLVSARHRQRKK